MNYDDLTYLIRHSTSDDWIYLPTEAENFGPIWRLVEDNAGRLVIESHTHQAIYKHNVSVSLAWGLELHSAAAGRPAHTFAWDDEIVGDPATVPFYLDVLWSGQAILRHVLAHVDGYRAVVPLVDRKDDDGHRYAAADDMQLARLVSEISRKESFDSYSRQLDVRVR